MEEKKELTKEELEQRVQQLEYELKKSIKIAKKLTDKIAKKEHENAILLVQFEEVAEGFAALQEIQKNTQNTTA
ncbi:MULTISPECIES: hypothetical protein [unclassified Bacillus (in: firmicutes)]|uniref:hypothetical protein n=1 Tax=unclassified Bacillus (in: firmicutes) TaxID=185979 RepID=UPI001BEAD15A|nr:MULTISPECIES: hypothetical protein [unclassified Bacillus (in: firmicutes)]MBT2614117.1 hypothetical protein [Bacillus sp. ISL-78]MBT2629372.1 hypothetical protein [Bacillus sp. ISL-101]